MSLDDADKQWIAEQLGLLGARVNHIAELLVQTAQFVRQLGNRLERAENTLLTDFHAFAHENELRLRGHEAALGGREATLRSLETRVDNLTDRVSKLESKP